MASMAAVAVLALTSAAVEPYLGAAGNAVTTSELERRGPVATGLTIRGTGVTTPDAALEVQRLVGRAAGDETATIIGVRVDPASMIHGDREQRVRLVAHSHALSNLEVVAGEPGTGVLVPEILAEDLGLAPGDEVRLGRGDAGVATRIDGIYRQPDPRTVPDELADLVTTNGSTAGRDRRPLDPVVGEPSAVLALAETLAARNELTWSQPTPTDPGGLDAVRATRRDLHGVAAHAGDPEHDLGAAVAEVLRGAPETSVGLDAVLRDADRAVAALSGPVRLVGVAGQAVALSLVGAAALFATRQRTRELRLASVRGLAPSLQGFLAACRALPILLIGSVFGWVAALILVAGAGPPGGLPSGVAAAALRDAAIAVVPALLVLVAITARAASGVVRVGRRRRALATLARAPWEVVPLGLAGLALAQVRADASISLEAGVPELSPLVLAFPVLVLLGAAGLVTRLASRGLPALRTIGHGRGHAGYLAIRRMATMPRSGLVLTAASTLALGLVVYSAAIAGSLATAVEQKSIIPIGADAAASGDADPAEVGGTRVLRARGRLAPTDEPVDVLLIDTTTFPQTAYWDRAFADGIALEELVAPLAGVRERLPVLSVGGSRTAAVLDVPGFRVPIETVGAIDTFPGKQHHRPLVVASLAAATSLAPGSPVQGSGPSGRWIPEIWAQGPDAADRLEAAGATLIGSGTDATAQPRLVAVTWALGALQGLAVLATALALVGIWLFLAGRQRETRVSYALARRMGLAPATHRLAVSLEVVVLLTVALTVAASVGVLAASAVAGGLDPLPELQPAPRAALPLATIGALAATLALVAVTGAALLQQQADRTDVAEVLRGG